MLKAFWPSHGPPSPPLEGPGGRKQPGEKQHSEQAQFQGPPGTQALQESGALGTYIVVLEGVEEVPS